MEQEERRTIDRQQLAAFVASLRNAMQLRVEQGLLPYDGRWMPAAEVQKAITRERRRAWMHAFELLLLYGALTSVSLVLIGLALYLCY